MVYPRSYADPLYTSAEQFAYADLLLHDMVLQVTFFSENRMMKECTNTKVYFWIYLE
jgi:hypothetical protein